MENIAKKYYILGGNYEQYFKKIYRVNFNAMYDDWNVYINICFSF